MVEAESHRGSSSDMTQAFDFLRILGKSKGLCRCHLLVFFEGDSRNQLRAGSKQRWVSSLLAQVMKNTRQSRRVVFNAYPKPMHLTNWTLFSALLEQSHSMFSKMMGDCETSKPHRFAR